MNKIKNILKSMILGVSFFTPIFSMEKELSLIESTKEKDRNYTDKSESSFKISVDLTTPQYNSNREIYNIKVLEDENILSRIIFYYINNIDFASELKTKEKQLAKKIHSLQKALEDIDTHNPNLILESQSYTIQQSEKDIHLCEKEIAQLKKIQEFVEKQNEYAQSFSNIKISLSSLAPYLYVIEKDIPKPIPLFKIIDIHNVFLQELALREIHMVNCEALQFVDFPLLKNIYIYVDSVYRNTQFPSLIKYLAKTFLPYNTKINIGPGTDTLFNNPLISRSNIKHNILGIYQRSISIFYDKIEIQNVKYLTYKTYHDDCICNHRFYTKDDIYTITPSRSLQIEKIHNIHHKHCKGK